MSIFLHFHHDAETDSVLGIITPSQTPSKHANRTCWKQHEKAGLLREYKQTLTVKHFQKRLSCCLIPGVREFCQLESLSATCASDEVILMQYARYGRMRLGRCVKVRTTLPMPTFSLFHKDLFERFEGINDLFVREKRKEVMSSGRVTQSMLHFNPAGTRPFSCKEM